MKSGQNKDLKPARPHSERAGEASLGDGGRAALYRALRELYCSRCGSVIREGDLFTREARPASRLPLLRLCRDCVPFKACGGLLDALFAHDETGEPKAASPSDGAREKALSRLGPALAARGKRGGGGDG